MFRIEVRFYMDNSRVEIRQTGRKRNPSADREQRT
jgi:hypothetical protein